MKFKIGDVVKSKHEICRIVSCMESKYGKIRKKYYVVDRIRLGDGYTNQITKSRGSADMLEIDTRYELADEMLFMKCVKVYEMTKTTIENLLKV